MFYFSWVGVSEILDICSFSLEMSLVTFSFQSLPSCITSYKAVIGIYWMYQVYVAKVDSLNLFHKITDTIKNLETLCVSLKGE